ncbi:MAG: hypothetical protein J5I93_31030 [Pirellulaceae bacterium]|nr:hypothetical protein [Pirellulaceae bacterium]
MSLEQWYRNGWLQQAEATAAELQRLLRVVDRDLGDAQAGGLSADGKFQHAYDAALQLCTVALRAAGYRVRKGQGHHKYGIDSLRFTLGVEWSETADYIERSSRLRAQAVYEQIGVVSQQDAEELLQAAKQLRGGVLNWLKATHPDLLPPDPEQDSADE